WFRTIVEQCNHAPVLAATVWHPVREFSTPDWQRFTADVVTAKSIERLFGIAQPHRIDANVIVRNRQYLALSDANACIQGRRASLFLFHHVTERNRKRLNPLQHHLAGVIGGIVVHDNHFPWPVRLETLQTLKRLYQLVSPVVSGDDYREPHSKCLYLRLTI